MSFNIIGSGGAGVPVVADEAERASNYPTPDNLQQVFNSRVQMLETYYTDFGLWLSDYLRPILCTSQTPEVLINGQPATPSDVQIYDILVRNTIGVISFSAGTYPLQNAFATGWTPTNNASADLVLGSVQQISSVNIQFGGNTYYFMAVAVAGDYYCRVRTNLALTINAGTEVGARATNTSRTITNTLGGVSRVGVTIEDMVSGAGFPNPSYNYALTKLSIRSKAM